MRRFAIFVLLVLFVIQSSGAAVAMPVLAVDAPRRPSILGELSLRLSQTIFAARDTYIAALLTNQQSHWQSMHAPAPKIPTERPSARPFPRQPALATMIYRAGRVVQERRPLAGPIDPVRVKNAVRGVTANPTISSGHGVVRKPAYYGPINCYIIGGGGGCGGGGVPSPTPSPAPTPCPPSWSGSAPNCTAPLTTGINRWWTYEEGTIPGVGKYMVNVANGNFIVQATDIDIPERGIDLAFQRTYNSQSYHTADNFDGTVAANYGDGWTNTFDAHIAYNTGLNPSCSSWTGITVYDIDGARYDFASDCNGGYVPPPGMQGTYVNATDSSRCTFQFTKKNGTAYYFLAPDDSTRCTPGSWSPDGRLISIYARNKNNYITLDYQTNDRHEPTQIIAKHSDGQQLILTFAYPQNQIHEELQSIQLPDGQTINYHYSASGPPELIEVDHPGNGISTSTSPTPNQLPEEYNYQNGFLRVVYGPRVWLSYQATSGNPQDGSAVFFDVDSTGRLNDVYYDGTVNFTPSDGVNQPLQGGVASGRQVWNESYFSGYGSGETLFTDRDGHSTKFDVDSNGRVIETQEWSGAPNNLWLLSHASWDGNNNITETVDTRGNATDYGYDANGNTIWVQQPAVTTSLGGGRPVARYSYDQYNNLVSYCDPQYVWTTGASTCPTSGPVTHYTWSSDVGADANEQYGRLTDTYTPLGYHHHIAYNTSAEAGGDYGLPTDVTGDPISQPIDSSTPERTPHLTMVYDGNGNVLCYSTLQDGTGTHWERAQYDGLNRRVASADADDSSLNVSQCSNSAGLPNSHIQSTVTYYQNGQVEYTQSPSEYAAGVSSSYSYDADGNLVSTTTHTGGVASTTTKWYDGADRLVEVREPQDQHDVYGFAWLTRYIYDLSQNGTYTRPSIGGQQLVAYGNLAATQECLSGTTVTAPYSTKPTSCTFTNMEIKGQAFDALDRMVKKYAFSGNSLSTETLNYDASGEAGLLSSDCKSSPSLTLPCTAYNYTTLGQTYAIAHNDGGVTPDFTYTYDPDSRTTSVAYTSNPSSAQKYSYDADGRLTQSIEPAGMPTAATLTYHYYADGMRQSLDVNSSALNQAGLFQYSYRQDGKLQTQAINTAFLSSAATTLHFAYSPAGRETALTYSGAGAPSAGPTYGFDTYGRQQSETIGAVSMAQRGYDPEGELTSYILSGQTTPQAITYTARGEIATDPQTPSATYANGIKLDAQVISGYVTMQNSQQFDARQGALLGYSSTCASNCSSALNPCKTGGSGTICPSGSFAYDGLGRMTQKIIASATKDRDGTVNENDTTTTNTYDADNRLTDTHVVPDAGGEQQNWYAWGPNGHPWQIGFQATNPAGCGSVGGCYLRFNQTLHWDGNQLLFVTGPNGQLADVKVGTLGDITPIDQYFSGITFYGRNAAGDIAVCYNRTGVYGTFGYSKPRNGWLCPSSASGTPNFQYAYQTGDGTAYTKVPVYLGRDGLYDWINTIQGVRAYDSDSGQWSTPDAYSGRVQDPMSQKSYVWNDGNPIAYADPSGYSAALFYDGYGGQSGGAITDAPDFATVENDSDQLRVDSSWAASDGATFGGLTAADITLLNASASYGYSSGASAAFAASAKYDGSANAAGEEWGVPIYLLKDAYGYGGLSRGGVDGVDIDYYKGLPTGAALVGEWHNHPLRDQTQDHTGQLQDFAHKNPGTPWTVWSSVDGEFVEQRLDAAGGISSPTILCSQCTSLPPPGNAQFVGAAI